jgi:hypothetical protein
MAQRFTDSADPVLFIAFKTGVYIIQSGDLLVAACADCRSDIHWYRNNGQWQCSDDEVCERTMKKVPIDASCSTFAMYGSTSKKQVREWVSHWIQVDPEDIVIGFDKK